MTQQKSIGVAIITHNAMHHLTHCLPPLILSPLKPRIVVVNSSSEDGTVKLAESMGVETLVIPRADFNHGATRERARKHLNTDIAVMLTPDAYAVNRDTLAKLVQPILNGDASVAYARQIPHDGADFFESFPRHFNYPEKSEIRSIQDVNKYGPYTFFCSNSCAAYCNKALDEVGGFETVLLGEDTLAIAKLIKKGHRIAYVAKAAVHHSHRYTLKQEFQRNFDTGLMRQQYGEVLGCSHHNDAKRGKQFVKEMLREAYANHPRKIPYALAQCTAKYAGYLLGRNADQWPLWLKKRFSSQDFYWTSNAYLKSNKK
jgi:rhamnosyltransferase